MYQLAIIRSEVQFTRLAKGAGAGEEPNHSFECIVRFTLLLVASAFLFANQPTLCQKGILLLLESSLVDLNPPPAAEPARSSVVVSKGLEKSPLRNVNELALGPMAHP